MEGRWCCRAAPGTGAFLARELSGFLGSRSLCIFQRKHRHFTENTYDLAFSVTFRGTSEENNIICGVKAENY